MRISNYIFSLALTIPFASICQVESIKDSARREFKPTGIRIGIDAVSIIKTATGKDFKGWELQADADFRNYFATVEIGRWSREVELINGQYSNSGNYFRIGVDANVLKKDPIKNMFFFGFRIGHSKYDESLQYQASVPIFGISTKQISNSNMSATWIELTTGLKVRILKSFWMGYTGRVKLLPSYSKTQQLQTYDIPGFGLTFKKPWWGFDYYLMFRIPIKKM